MRRKNALTREISKYLKRTYVEAYLTKNCFNNEIEPYTRFAYNMIAWMCVSWLIKNQKSKHLNDIQTFYRNGRVKIIFQTYYGENDLIFWSKLIPKTK